MCFFGASPSAPPAPPPPAPPAPPPPAPVLPPSVSPAGAGGAPEASEDIAKARERNRTRAALAQGRKSNILTSGLGLTTPATTIPKTVLGA